jgi:hypothetical protein
MRHSALFSFGFGTVIATQYGPKGQVVVTDQTQKKTQPMKNIITLLAAFVFTLSFANTALAQATTDTFVSHPAFTGLSEKLEETIPTILSLQVPDLLEENVIGEALRTASKEFTEYQSTPTFRRLYWEGRRAVFGSLWDHKLYDQVRALVLTRVKNYLHQPGNLAALYTKSRPQLLENMQTLSVDQRGRLGLQLLAAQQTFTSMKDPATHEIFKHIDEVRKKVDRDAMRENLSDEEMAQAIISREVISYWDFDEFRRQELAKFADWELAEFAWRRYCEGGDVLIDEYLKVIGLLSVDLLSIKDKG